MAVRDFFVFFGVLLFLLYFCFFHFIFLIMETGCVFDMVKGGMGIAELNEMQRAMGADVSRRVMLTAPTGSGKTVAFVIRMLREVRPWVPWVQGLVVAPTRELVRQVAGVVKGILNFEGGRAEGGFRLRVITGL